MLLRLASVRISKMASRLHARFAKKNCSLQVSRHCSSRLHSYSAFFFAPLIFAPSTPLWGRGVIPAMAPCHPSHSTHVLPATVTSAITPPPHFRGIPATCHPTLLKRSHLSTLDTHCPTRPQLPNSPILYSVHTPSSFSPPESTSLEF